MADAAPIFALIPARDEQASIAAVVDAVLPRVSRVLVIDNGSSDRTAERATSAGATLVLEPRRGYGSACLAGITALHREPDSAVIVFFDGDGQSEPTDIERVIAPIVSGEAELVIGSRVKGAEPGALTAAQRFGNAVATRLLGAIYGSRATDLGPLRALRLGTLRGLGLRDRGFGWTIEMQTRAAARGLRVLEVPVSYRRRRAGVSKISGTVLGSARAGVAILWTLLAAQRR